MSLFFGAVATFTVYRKNKSDNSNISIKYNCDWRVFPLNGVTHRSRKSCKILFRVIYKNHVCFRLFTFVQLSRESVKILQYLGVAQFQG